MFVRASLYKRREENQLDVTEWFIALIICSTCFRHLYTYHQELENIIMFLPHMVCNAVRMKRYNWCWVQLHPSWFSSLRWDTHFVRTWWAVTVWTVDAQCVRWRIRR